MNARYNKCGRFFLLILAIVVVLCSSACSRVTITLNANGGLVNGKNSIKHTITNGDSFNKLPEPTREGYSFEGWYTAATGGTKITKNSPAPTKNTTYYAHWKAKQITITWNANGGSKNYYSSQKVGQKIKLCAYTPTREGYFFEGWYTAATGGTKITKNSPAPTKNTTYYAHWEEATTKPTASTTKPTASTTKPTTAPTEGNVIQNYDIPEDLMKFAATVYSESGGENARTKNAVAHSMWNRIGYGEWKNKKDIVSVLSQPSQYTSYGNTMWKSAIEYYQGKEISNSKWNNDLEKAAMDEALTEASKVYYGEADWTGRVVFFHSLKNAESWPFHEYYNQVSLDGTECFWWYTL